MAAAPQSLARQQPSRGPQARHRVIETELLAEIETGRHRLGDCLPGEHALCQRFGASRFTIRQAIRSLADKGLVAARPGVGTVVIATSPPDAFVQTLNSIEELLQYPAGTSRTQLDVSRAHATAEMAQMLDCLPGQPWVRLQAMRLLSGTQLPISWLEAHVLPRFADVIDHPNPDGAPLLKQIEAAHGHRAAQAQVEIRSGRISAEQAGPLRAEEGAPALLILRRYRGSDGQVYLMTRSSHPENRFSLNFMFQKQ